MLSVIVAIAQNYAIGKNNQLLWHLSADLKYFKKLTSGKTVIMGKKTYESLPVQPLPNRRSIIISDNPDDCFGGCIMASSIEDAVSKCNLQEESFIIGGGSIYHQFMPLADRLYITWVYKDFDADTFFPEIREEKWQLKEKGAVQIDDATGLHFSFCIYERKRESPVN
ncbi:MAG: dihydrofolate reductase [Lentimicrobiaceae bacterium]|nr:dihydrofolate reductase [Lentimicrobiaceae bacterium]